MYQIKQMFTKHIEENILKYIIVLSIFAVGIITGFFFSQSVPESLSEDLTQEIGALIEEFSDGAFDKSQILMTSFLKNLRFFLFILVGGLSAFLLPLAFGALFSYGFSIGFTISYMSLCFGGQGLVITMISVIFAFLINIPIYVALAVVAVNNCRNKKYKDSNYAAYILIFVFLFLISLFSVAADVLIIPVLIRLICS